MKKPTKVSRYCKKWGAYFREIRTRRDMTARALAEKANVDPSYITLIERDGAVPSRCYVERLAIALGADQDFFMGQAGYATPNVFNAWLRSQGLKPLATTSTARPQARKQAVHG